MIHLDRHGAGSHVFVALHGWGSSHATWAPLTPFIPAGASLLALDLPGYGRSVPLAAAEAEDVAAAILDAIRSDGTERITVVGNCSGGVFALLAAAAAENRIERLVLIVGFFTILAAGFGLTVPAATGAGLTLLHVLLTRRPVALLHRQDRAEAAAR